MEIEGGKVVTYGKPICLDCDHFHYEDKKKNVCDAYKEGIPEEILDSSVDHRKPYKGDNGIQFEEIG